MNPITLLAAVGGLWFVVWLAIQTNSPRLRTSILTLEIAAGAIGKLATLEFREARRMAWLTWRLYRMDQGQLVSVLAAVEIEQARELSLRG
jgi:hypothetical protein